MQFVHPDFRDTAHKAIASFLTEYLTPKHLVALSFHTSSKYKVQKRVEALKVQDAVNTHARKFCQGCTTTW